MSNHLLPPNATELEKNISITLDRISNVPIDIQKIYNPDECPEFLLPWLAWALSVDFWDADFTEAQKREAIKRSHEIHKHKGTVASLEYALGILNITFDIEEWFEHDGEPHTFTLNAWADSSFEDNGVIITDVISQKVVNIVQKTKPVRSHATINIGARSNQDMAVVGNINILPIFHHSAECELERSLPQTMGITGNISVLSLCHFTMEA